MTEELTFHLEEFEGPLELLLALVSKHKMDLHNIPILELIDQYTRTVEAAQAVDPDISSSFIEMAAHLVEMKSYLLLPRSTEGERMKQELTGLRPTADAAGTGRDLRPQPSASGAGRLLGEPDGPCACPADADPGRL